MFCKYCGKELPDNAQFCSKCGRQLVIEKSNETVPKSIPSSDPYESKTDESKSVKNETAFTHTDDTPHYVQTESTKSRLAAALLAFFLGEFGAHRFYVGKTGSAVVQLVLGLSFFIGLICAALDGIELAAFFFVVGIAWSFWLFIDFIIILCGSFKDKDGLPLTDWGL